MGYRSFDEINSYITRDPLVIFRSKMINSGEISEVLLNKLASQVDNYVGEVLTSVLNQNKDFLAQFEMNK